ncbi:hypothetical protein [Variovorax sp. JS1663]|uniref:hypothetical protein n=1 Tax=Variovorax sp. JS1663 TaxID=1851577 RepID=UPI001302CEA2|nr:hypothetical protein [Variovorax sp. JS1663]
MKHEHPRAEHLASSPAGSEPSPLDAEPNPSSVAANDKHREPDSNPTVWDDWKSVRDVA